MSKEKSYRVSEMDGLPKLMAARDWVDLVTRERPRRAQLAGVIAFDFGEGVEPALLGWTGQMAIAAPLARLSARVAALFPAQQSEIKKFTKAAQRGEYTAATARKRAS